MFKSDDYYLVNLVHHYFPKYFGIISSPPLAIKLWPSCARAPRCHVPLAVHSSNILKLSMYDMYIYILHYTLYSVYIYSISYTMWHMKYHVIVFTCFMILLTSDLIFEKPHPLGLPVSSFQARIWSSSKFQLATSTGQNTPQSPSWFKIHQLNSKPLVMVFPCLSAFYCFGTIHW